jgi:hypothetical protein
MTGSDTETQARGNKKQKNADYPRYMYLSTVSHSSLPGHLFLDIAVRQALGNNLNGLLQVGL